MLSDQMRIYRDRRSIGVDKVSAAQSALYYAVPIDGPFPRFATGNTPSAEEILQWLEQNDGGVDHV